MIIKAVTYTYIQFYYFIKIVIPQYLFIQSKNTYTLLNVPGI